MSAIEKTEKTVVQVLREAKHALTVKGWIKGYYARDKKKGGSDVMGWDTKAKCFCALGAIQYSNGEYGDYRVSLDAGMYLERALFKRIGPVPNPVAYSGDDIRNEAQRRFVPQYNDAPERTVEEVLSLFDEAIDLAIAGEGDVA